MRKIVVFLFVLPFMLTKCTYDNEEDYYVCDTLDVRYSSVVRPLLEDYGCIGCHNNFVSEGDIVLSDYESLAEAAEDVLGAIQHRPGYEPMPYQEPMMDECAINKIKTWINDGMPDN